MQSLMGHSIRRESLLGIAAPDYGTTASAVTTRVSSKRKLEAVFFAAARCVTASFLVTNDQPGAAVEVFVLAEANNDGMGKKGGG